MEQIWTPFKELICLRAYYNTDFPGGSVVKNTPANAGDTGSIPELGGFPLEGNANPLWYSCLETPMDRGSWWATVHGNSKESDVT